MGVLAKALTSSVCSDISNGLFLGSILKQGGLGPFCVEFASFHSVCTVVQNSVCCLNNYLWHVFFNQMIR